MPHPARRFGVVIFMLVFSLVGFGGDDVCLGPSSNFEGLDGPTWTAVELNGVPHAGTGWFLKDGTLIHYLQLKFSAPFEGSLTATVSGTVPPETSSQRGNAAGRFVYDGGSPGVVTLDISTAPTVKGTATLNDLAGDDNYRHGTIVLEQVLGPDKYRVTYSR